jgi:glucose/arabinose dehydrogenase
MKTEQFQRGTIIVTLLAILLLAAGASAQNLFFGAAGDEGVVAEIMTNGSGSTYATLGFTFPSGLAFDTNGDLFVAGDPDSDGVGGNNIIEVNANRPQKIFSTTVKRPFELAFNSAGDLFEADYSSSNIYEFTNHAGILVSNVNVFASGLNGPFGLAFDNAGNLFESDVGSSNIYKFTTNGTKTLFASGLSYPAWLAFNGAGNLFASVGFSNIYEFTTNGGESVFATNLPEPSALAFNRAGVLFVMCDGYSSSLIEILPNKTRISLGPASYGGGLAFQGMTLPVSAPFASSITTPNLFVASANNGILEISQVGTQTTFASTIYAGNGGPIQPYQMTFDSYGNLFGTSQSGWVFGFPVGGIQGSLASLGPATTAGGLALNSVGAVFVANDSANNILEVMPNGSTNVFASGLDNPQGLAFDRAGDLFEADESSGKIYEFTNNAGTLNSNSTVFATGLGQPIGLAFDSSGDLFEADERNGNINEFTNNNGTLSSSPFLFASGLSEPWSLTFNSAGDLLETDHGSGNVYEFAPNGTRITLASGLSNIYGLAFEPVPALQASSLNGTIQVTVTMPSPYYSTILQASPDLVNWASICTNTPPFAFTNTSPSSQYFYRAVLNQSLY